LRWLCLLTCISLGARIISDILDTSVDTLLVVQTIGGVSFTVRHPDGRTVELDIKTKKTRALLAFLSLSEGKFESRDRLASLLWPNVEMKKARASLRMALMDIRKHFDDAHFYGYDFEYNDQISLDQKQVQVDVKDIQAALVSNTVHTLLLREDRIIDRLLEDCEGLEPEFGADVAVKRGTLQQRLPFALTKLMENANAEKSVRLDAARALHLLEASNEKAVRALMLEKVDAGDTNGALNLYNVLYDLLDREYQWAPDKETQELNAAIKRGDIGPDRPDAEAPRAMLGLISAAPVKDDRRLIIGVSAFNLAGLPPGHLREIVNGFRGELIGSLLKFREWSVRSHVELPNDQKPDPKARGEYVIDASAIQAGNKVRLVMMLREVATAKYIWSHKVMLAPEDWFDRQDRLIREIAMALGIFISAERLERIDQTGASSLAHDRLLRAKADLIARQPVKWEQSVCALNALAQEFPDFARAHSLLASLQNLKHFMFPGVMRSLGAVQAATAASKQAILIDSLDPMNQLAFAWSLALGGQYDSALAYFRGAQSLNDSDPWVAVSTATGMALCGDVAAGESGLSDVLELLHTPSAPHHGYAATVHFVAGNYSKVVQHAPLAIEQSYAPLLLAAAHAHLGNCTMARQTAAELFRLSKAAWATDISPSRKNISAWALQLMPIKSESAWSALRDGLHSAGGECLDITRANWPATLQPDVD
jgi:DNA-binding SARP family transcriptional activator/TolB-like protein